MEIQLTPNIAKRMLRGAYVALAENREEINRRNEFPVPDGDTGSNMAMTVGGVISRVSEKDYGQDHNDFLSDLEQSLLESISGNAGTISAGFLSGFFSELCGNGSVVDADKFCRALSKGRARAVSSVYNPREGTMLDVISAADEGAQSHGDKNIEDLFRQALKAAQDLLPETNKRLAKTIAIEVGKEQEGSKRKNLEAMQERIESLARQGIGDAGAMGFVFMLEGLGRGMFSKEDIIVSQDLLVEVVLDEISDIGEGVNLDNPYEVQFILEPGIHKDEIPEFLRKLGELGDSLDTFATVDGDYLRVHIHTNKVEAVQEIVERHGHAFNIRVVDMRREIEAQGGNQHKVMIVTDAGADLPWSSYAQGALVVPFQFNFMERRNLIGSFYERMLKAKEWPTTSQPSPGAFAKRMKDALRFAEEIVVITISSKVSGSYNSALFAKQSLPEEFSRRVHVFDSLNAACGQALIVQRALDLIEENKGVDEIMPVLGYVRGNIKFFGYPQNIEYLIRGGRLKEGTFKAKVARWLQKIGVHPKLSLVNGSVGSTGIPKSGKFDDNLYEEFMTIKPGFLRHSNRRAYCAISYAGMKREALNLKRRIEAHRDVEVLFAEQLNRVIGIHTGPSLMVAWYCDEHN